MSFLPAKHNFKISIGSTWRYRFEWRTATGGIAEAENLENFSALMKIVPVGDTVPWLELTNELSENGSGIILGGSSGFIDLLISDVDTERITWSQAKYALWVKDLLGDKDPLLVGQLSATSPL